MDEDVEVLRVQSAFHGAAVHRAGDVVVKGAGPWTPAVHSLLRHLESVGFAGSPRLVGSGLDREGRQLLGFIEGGFLEAGVWSPEAAAGLGELIRDLHRATSGFELPTGAAWYPWFGRDLGGSERVVGHCDLAPWNVVQRDGWPVALIDWEFAGPVDPVVDLAQAAWLNSKLHNDVVVEDEGLPALDMRLECLRGIVDGYGLAAEARDRFVGCLIDVAVCSAASDADEAGVRRYSEFSTFAPALVWALAWRSRDAAWLVRNRELVRRALG